MGTWHRSPEKRRLTPRGPTTRPACCFRVKGRVSSGGGDMGPPGLSCVAGWCVTWRSHAGKPHTLAVTVHLPWATPAVHSGGRLLSTKRLSEDVHGGLFIGGVKRNQPMCAPSVCTQATVCVFSCPPPGVKRPGPLVHLCRRLPNSYAERSSHMSHSLWFHRRKLENRHSSSGGGRQSEAAHSGEAGRRDTRAVGTHVCTDGKVRPTGKI